MAVDTSPFDNYHQSIFDDIVGFEEIKGFISLAFKSDKPVHMWFIGPPACAKSLILEKLEDIGGVMVFGSKITKDGLIRILLEKKPVLLMIDEIEKVNHVNDLSPLLTWTQDGRVKRDTSKDSDDYKIESPKWMVFVASNSIKRFKKDMPELLSRFEKFQIPEYKKNEFETIVCNVLVNKEQVEPALAKNIAMNLAQRFRFNVREAQAIARLVKNEDNPFMGVNTVFKTKDIYAVD